MEEFDYLKSFIRKNYFEFLLDNNITMINLTSPYNLTYLIYKEEIFIFDSPRSLNQAYSFYNIEHTICLEGMEYYKITKDYLNYLSKDDNNVKMGKTLKYNKQNYLINYFSKGYKNVKNLSLKKANKYIYFLYEFCSLLSDKGLKQPKENEYLAIINITNLDEYNVDFYIVDSIEPVTVTNKFGKNKTVSLALQNKEYSNLNAKTGLFFIDGYKDCFTLLENRTGCFIYYALDDMLIYIKKYDFISKEDIYNFYAEIFSEYELPVHLTTDNDFLFDLLNKSLVNILDFELNKSCRHCSVITKLALTLTVNNYDEYNIDAFTMILENNYNSVSQYVDEMSQNDFDSMVESCLNSYRFPNQDDMLDELDFEEEEEILNIDVDTELVS